MGASPYYIEIILLCLLCTIMSNSVTCSLKVHCNNKDMNRLLDFKQGVTDPSGLLSSWSTEKDCCQWAGVQCHNTTGSVTELSLPCHTVPATFSYEDDKSHCLTGELDLSLLDLEFLSHLNLSDNDFKAIQYNHSMHNHTCNDLSSGVPPRQCRDFSNLRFLDLSHNYDLLIDDLNWISSLSFLQHLDLSGINLHEEIDWLRPVTLLPSLSELYLASCQLRNIYPSLQHANFTSLDVLDLSGNDFMSELPGWMFNLSCDISRIDLSDNNIRGQLPRILPNLRSLNSLDLSANNLDGPLPDWLGQLEQLQELHLAENSFSGPVPTSLGNLSSLTTLDLNNNTLNGDLPESLGKLFNLEVLSVLDNFMTGNISERNFHSLSKLKRLRLGSPALIHDFDPGWIPPFQLQFLRLQYVSPKLPSWLYTQTSLKVLTIEDSRVSFERFDKLCKFAAQIEFVSLGNNSINADMSNVFLNSKVVLMDGNNLTGSVPQVSPNVTILKLEDNSLSGSISPLLCQQMKENPNLEYLDISGNNLSGEIPDCWMNWKSLLHVHLGGNNLTGKLPHSIGSLPNLISLNLEDNKLSGKVPLSLKNYKNLRILNLGKNKFSGAIPSWIGQSVRALQLRSNQFSGNIPTAVCQLHSLKILDFANNRLSGPIPNCLHNMTTMISEYASIDQFFIRLRALNITVAFRYTLTLLIKGMDLSYSFSMYAVDLSSNNLSGTIPSELFMLTRLQSLNLSHNQLMGMIPPAISNLKQLESLDLSSNHLSGQIPQSMSGMSFLGVLNLSFNNFVGKIPSGTQLQGFTNLSYMGNPELCGPPLTKSCAHGGKSHNANRTTEHDDEESEVHSMFYMGLGIGFATGFWGVLGAIFFNKRCRHAYFRFLGRLHDMVVLKTNSIYWNLRNCFRW